MVTLPEKTGFCFGVKRAVAMAEAALKKKRPIYSLGSLIHNEQVVRALKRKGLRVANSPEEVRRASTVVISSHGISPKVAARVRRRGIKIIDTTCPFVLKAQRNARRLSGEGYLVVIVGDANHPEVRALVDFASGKARVVKDAGEAKALKFGRNDRISVISQTTQSPGNFFKVVRAVSAKGPREIKVFNTICRDAEERQALARRLAEKVDVMIVIGGRHSANTKRLFEVCRKVLRSSYLIETEGEVRKSWFKAGGTVGVTNGASTPDWVINRVVGRVKKMTNSYERGCAINVRKRR